jgi:hypothetical protein
VPQCCLPGEIKIVGERLESNRAAVLDGLGFTDNAHDDVTEFREGLIERNCLTDEGYQCSFSSFGEDQWLQGADESSGWALKREYRLGSRAAAQWLTRPSCVSLAEINLFQ